MDLFAVRPWSWSPHRHRLDLCGVCHRRPSWGLCAICGKMPTEVHALALPLEARRALALALGRRVQPGNGGELLLRGPPRRVRRPSIVRRMLWALCNVIRDTYETRDVREARLSRQLLYASVPMRHGMAQAPPPASPATASWQATASSAGAAGRACAGGLGVAGLVSWQPHVEIMRRSI